MQEIENNSNKDLEKIDQDINFHRIIIFLIIIAVVFFYLIMKDIDVEDAAQHWGPVGDFFGGILNPIFALFAFYWLTYSVRLQIKELKETREELKKAAAAQVESAIHQKSIAELENENVITQKELLALQEKTLLSQQMANKAQQEQIEIQNFENLFFELLKTKSNMMNDITFSSLFFEEETSFKDGKIFLGKEAFREGVRFFKNNYKNFGWLAYYNKYLSVHWSTYFNLCFYIINIVDRGELNLVSESIDLIREDRRKKYFEIFKVTFSQFELESLFFLMLFETKYIGIKKKVEKYSMFAFLDVDHKRYEDKYSKLTSIAYLYNENAFGNNPNWKRYFYEIQFINVKMTEKKAKLITKMLVKIGYLSPSSIFNPFLKKVVFSIVDNYEVNYVSNDQLFGNVITTYNQDVMKKFYHGPYHSLVSQIKNKEMAIDDIKKLIRLIKENCVLNNELFEINKQYQVEGYSSFYIPKDLYNLINNYKKEILKLKDELKELDVVFDKLENSEYLETILVLLKYQIDFDNFKLNFS